GCNSTKGYSDQDAWDWWSFMIPRKIVCEEGQNQVECNDAVNKYIMPPAPPPNTSQTTGASRNGGRGGSPGIGSGTWVILGSVATVLYHRRCRKPPADGPPGRTI